MTSIFSRDDLLAMQDACEAIGDLADEVEAMPITEGGDDIQICADDDSRCEGGTR